MSEWQINTAGNLVSRLLILDGPVRTGKFGLASVVSGFGNIDFVHHDPQIENIGIMWRLGGFERAAAATYLGIALNSLIYDIIIGRTRNMRPTDRWSMYNAPDYHELMTRTVMPDGPESVDRYEQSGRTPFLSVHDVLPNHEIYFDCHPGLKFIRAARHPIDIADGWRRRGWPKRHGNDSRAFSPSVRTGDATTPHWARDWIDDYINEQNEYDLVLKSVLYVLGQYDDALRRMTDEQRRRVMTLSLDVISENPENCISQLSEFLDCEPQPQMNQILVRERMPDHSLLEQRIAKFKLFGENCCDPELFERFSEFSARYEDEHGLESALS